MFIPNCLERTFPHCHHLLQRTGLLSRRSGTDRCSDLRTRPFHRNTKDRPAVYNRHSCKCSVTNVYLQDASVNVRGNAFKRVRVEQTCTVGCTGWGKCGRPVHRRAGRSLDTRSQLNCCRTLRRGLLSPNCNRVGSVLLNAHRDRMVS